MFVALHPRAKHALCCFVFGLTTGLAAPAIAQRPSTDPLDRDRGTSARTVLGTPDALACQSAAAAGMVDASLLARCDRALRVERLSRAGKVVTHINRGALHLRLRNGAAALADFDAALAIEPDHAEAHLNRGAALVMVGDAGQAVAAITTALGLGVREPHKAYFNRGAARERLGDLRGALEDYTTALQIQPDWGLAEEELRRFVVVRRDRLVEQLTEAGVELDSLDAAVGSEPAGAAPTEPQ